MSVKECPLLAKGRKNPFLLFCLEQEQLKPELKGKAVAQLVQLCSPSWQAMDMQARMPYVNEADAINKRGYPGAGGAAAAASGRWEGKFDCFGRSMAALKKQERLDACKCTLVKLILLFS